MRRFLAVLFVALATFLGGRFACAQDGIPVTLYWHMADDADVYLNGSPLRMYEPSYRYRGDEAPHPPFSYRTTLRDGDLFTVGGRRGGSFGFMLIAVDDYGKPVFTTNTRDWSVYYPGERRDWPVLSQYGPRRPVMVQANPWGPQRDLNQRFGYPAQSIWSDPADRFAHLVGIVALAQAAWAPPPSDLPPDEDDAASYDLPPETVGVTVSSYPELVQVPGYPVYYAPGMNSNYFFYDGMFWLFQGDQWFASSWFNGPWGRIRPESVPVFVLRVPVSYYRNLPPYFGGWRRDAPPRWGEHWGPAWERRQHGWDTWDHRATFRPAPLPDYQRGYAGNRYPRAEQQHALHTEHYHYEPTSPVARQHFQQVQHPQPQGRPQPAAPSGFQRPAPAPQAPMGGQRPLPAPPQPAPGQHPAPLPQPGPGQHPAPPPQPAPGQHPAPSPQPAPGAPHPAQAPAGLPHQGPGVQHPTLQQAPVAAPKAPAPQKPAPPAKPAAGDKKKDEKK